MKTYVCTKCNKTVCVVTAENTSKPEFCPMGKCPAWGNAVKPEKRGEKNENQR